MRTLSLAVGVITLAALGTVRADVAMPAAKPAAAPAAKPAMAPAPAAAAAPTDKQERVFTCIATDHDGIKRWEPGTFIVYEGDHVKFKLYNRVDPRPEIVHGFSIAAFNVKVVVAGGNKEPVIAEFTADKVGLYDINCHLHPAHVGGQLLVLKK